MAKKKLEVNLKPIKDQIKKAQQELRGLKPQAIVGARKKIDLEVKRLDDVASKLAKICKGKMTVGFAPSDDEE
jgi:anaerobic ribonucleoside-triphosphate reductase